jgi:hypothetical protein
MGLAIAALGLPIFLGFAIGFLPPIRPFFAGDRTRWRRFWMTTVAALWLAAALAVALMARFSRCCSGFITAASSRTDRAAQPGGDRFCLRSHRGANRDADVGDCDPFPVRRRARSSAVAGGCRPVGVSRSGRAAISC